MASRDSEKKDQPDSRDFTTAPLSVSSVSGRGTRGHSEWKRPWVTFDFWLAVLFVLITSFGALAVYYWLPIAVVDGPTATSDINQLSAAAQAFKAEYAMYPPSKFRLCSNHAEYDPKDPLDMHSLACINRMWPNIGSFKDILWDGGKLPAGGVVLEGDQRLVFFLGGIPDGPVEAPCRGFATNPKNPAAREGGTVGPFFWFSADRLVKLRGGAFCSYLDFFDKAQPYAYFSANGRRGGYNPFGTSDCAGLGVWPYARSLGPNPRYHNPNSFQIISAGPDGLFGPGTVLPDGKVWSPETTEQIDPAGRDDRSNFHDAPLGTRRD